MNIRLSLTALLFAFLVVPSLVAQDLGPHFRKIKEGIYIQTSRPVSESTERQATSNGGIIVTSEGIVLVDSGQTAIDSREIAEAAKKLSPLPVRFIINTETHQDHSYGHWLFSPPAVVINTEGAGNEMRESFNPNRAAEQSRQSPQMAEALKDFRLVPPQLEFGDKLTLHVGERTLELLNLGTTHSLANAAVWLPNERVLFAASVAVENQINTIRPHTNIPDMLAMMKMMKALNPEVVIPGHGAPTTTKMFDFYSGYLETLVDRVGKLMRDGKSLDQIKQELRMPEYENFIGYKERIANNIEAAHRAIQGGYRP